MATTSRPADERASAAVGGSRGERRTAADARVGVVKGAEVYELLASGAVKPTVTVIGFDDIPEGIEDLRNHRITGRLVAHIAD
jgi:D-arabinose 1-dehydrogenase-like Zn-dependent alcohol dehydrogenase